MTPNLLVDTSKGQVVTSSGKHLAEISLIQYRLPKGVSCCHYQVIRSFTEKLMAVLRKMAMVHVIVITWKGFLALVNQTDRAALHTL